MTGVLGVFAAMLIICLVSSDAEGRRAARKAVNRWARWLLVPTLIMLALILWPVAGWLANHPP